MVISAGNRFRSVGLGKIESSTSFTSAARQPGYGPISLWLQKYVAWRSKAWNTLLGRKMPQGSVDGIVHQLPVTKASQLATQQLALMAEEDLVVASPSDRNWKGIIIAVLVISSVLALIVTSVVLLTPPDLGPRVKGKRFELEDIFGPDFQPLRMNGSWISGNEWMFRDEYGGIWVLNVETMKRRWIVSNFTMSRYGTPLFTLSGDKLYALLTHDITKIHRYSFHAKYTVVDILAQDSKDLFLTEKLRKEMKFQLVKWAPVDSALVIVHQGDIYYKEMPNDTSINRITDTAQAGIIYNGIPDWLYEEEVLGSNSALWFSPNAHHLLYLTFNDSLVGEHHLLQYGNPEQPHQYPQVRTLRYPKPGTNNPTVTATICELKGENRFGKKNLIPPEAVASQEYYIVGAGWIGSSQVSIIWTARSHNLSIISTCSISTGVCVEEYRIMSEPKGWVDSISLPIFSSRETNSKNFVAIVPIRDGKNGFFDHLVFVDTRFKRSHPVTHGTTDVIKIHAWDETNQFVYYTATSAERPNERRLYRVKVEAPYSEHTPECLTCPTAVPLSKLSVPLGVADHVLVDRVNSRKTAMGPEDLADLHRRVVSKDNVVLRSNKSCSFVTKVKFSPTYNYYVMECGGAEIPYVALYSISALTIDPASSKPCLMQVMQNNDALLNLSRQMAFPQVRIFPVILTSGKSVQVKLLLPPGLREDEITQYPLIINIYGGPGTQLAVDRWAVEFTTYLATKKDYIVAQIDGRGSGGRGFDYQHEVHYNLGHLEADDQIEVTKYLRDSLPYVETNKVGIFGWSYGGYLTALIMTNKDKLNLFQCGASIAPVSKWELYDSAYTERYMGTPNLTDNYKGYVNSDITKNLENFDKKMFYLLHGTGDDNVHIQHSMLLAKALVNKKIMFRQQIYPDEEHNLNGVKLHVHRSLEEFFDDCYKKQKTPEVETGLNKGGKFDDFD